jgi:type IV secretion system protein VirB5
MRITRILLAAWLAITAIPTAHAQWAVIDVGAIAQLVREVAMLQQQLQTAEAQLNQANVALQTMTGTRGMQLLLASTVRNYLPTNSSQLTAALQGGGAYPSLASDVRAAINANAVLSTSQLSALSPTDQRQIAAGRQAAALRQAVAEEALANSSSRFAELQDLIAAISTAKDQKAILDLQARISAELGMLQNEQTKLQTLARASDAMAAVNAQQQIEQAIAGQGQFSARFTPVP